MAATLTQERFTGPEWTFECKYDGIRLISFKRGDDVQCYSRNHLPQDVPHIAAAIRRLPHDELILDGELAWDGSECHVFDLLWCDGRDLRALTLDERRTESAKLPLVAPLQRTLIVEDNEPWERACKEGWEGVIAKRRDRLRARRSRRWLKMKFEAGRARRRRVHRSRGRARRAGRATRRLLRRRRLRVRGKVGPASTRSAARAAPAPGRARGRQDAVSADRAARRALGAAGAGRGGRVHGVDRWRQAAPSAPHRLRVDKPAREVTREQA